MKASELYTIWLKSAHLGQGKTLTISSVDVETLHPRPTTERQYLVLSFKETVMRAIVNQTNANNLVRDLGDETGAWVGRQVKLTPATRNGKATFDMKGLPK